MINIREPNESLFENSRMSFGEHLEELRVVLIRAVIGIVIGCVFGFMLADRMVNLLTGPLEDAIAEFEHGAAERRLTGEFGYVPPSYQPLLNEGFLPRRAFVNPGELVRGLQTVIPEFGQSIEIDTHGFRAEHFDAGQLQQLCQKLAQQAGDDSEQTTRLEALWQQMTTAEQATVQRLADDSQPSGGLTDVLGIFNRISKLDSFYQLDVFKDLVTPVPASWWSWFQPPAAKPLADLKTTIEDPKSTAADQMDVRRQLNRALITSLFPDQIRPVRIDVFQVNLWEQSDFRPQSLGVTETFFVWMKAGVFTGLTLSAPWVFYQIWSFVAAGLYPHEKKYIHLFLPVSILLFVSGVLLAFFFVFQPVLGFLFSFNQSLGIAPQMRIGEWLGFAMFLPFGFGVAFQLPLVMVFLNRIGLLSVEMYLNKWRIAVMVIFVLAMFLTPADPISMLLLAVPLTILYFMGIGMCHWLPTDRNPFGDDATGSATP